MLDGRATGVLGEKWLAKENNRNKTGE